MERVEHIRKSKTNVFKTTEEVAVLGGRKNSWRLLSFKYFTRYIVTNKRRNLKNVQLSDHFCEQILLVRDRTTLNLSNTLTSKTVARQAILNLQNWFVLTLEIHVYHFLHAKLGSMDWLQDRQWKDRGSILGKDSDYCLLHSVQIGCAYYLVGTRGDFPPRLEHETKRSPPSTAEVTMRGRCLYS
jgi:hypothetical protein